LLLVEHDRRGKIDLRSFWMRRALRLYPALVVAIAGALLLAWLKMPIFGATNRSLVETLKAVPFTLFYTMNIPRAAGWSGGGMLGHAWSLAIEEQFYLIWPVVAVVLLKRRYGVIRVAQIAAVGAVVSAALRAGLDAGGVRSELLHNATFSHIDGVLAGCALAVGRRSYGLYIYHWPIFVFIGMDGRLLDGALGFAAAFIAAWFSFAVIEQLFLRMKGRWTTPSERVAQAETA
jgi:peptidoglycan/LPS O-acetylase OafA/YrhL